MHNLHFMLEDMHLKQIIKRPVDTLSNDNSYRDIVSTSFENINKEEICKKATCKIFPNISIT